MPLPASSHDVQILHKILATPKFGVEIALVEDDNEADPEAQARGAFQLTDPLERIVAFDPGSLAFRETCREETSADW